jgi:hypothetical protein
LIWTAARVSDETRLQPFARRSEADPVGWVGVFRRGDDGEWSAYSLSGALDRRSLLSVNGAASVSARSIAPSIEDAAPGAAFRGENTEQGER